MGEPAIETTLAPWLTVSDGTAAVEYYRATLGAVDTYRLADDEGRLTVARLEVGAAVFWVQEDATAAHAIGGPSLVRMVLTVDDPDAVFERAVAAGAVPVASVHEEFGWRTGRVTDPLGHDWEFSRPLAS